MLRFRRRLLTLAGIAATVTSAGAVTAVAAGGCASFSSADEGPPDSTTEDRGPIEPRDTGSLDGPNGDDARAAEADAAIVADTNGMVRIAPAGGAPYLVDSTEVTVSAFLAVANVHAWPPPGADLNCKAHWRPLSGEAQTATYDPAGMKYTTAPGAPVNYVSWCAADAYCKAIGKRLCRAGEWTRACRGPAGLTYPYGNTYTAGACNTNDASIKVVESYAQCNSADAGVYDLVGNVAEWGPDCSGGQCDVYGSAYRYNIADSICAKVHQTARDNEADDVGFRCCIDAP